MRRTPAVIGATTALFLGAAVGSPALAQDDTAETLTAQLSQMNESAAIGTATVQIEGNQVTVSVQSADVSAGLPHAQHIHIGGENRCPPLEVAVGDGLIDTVEGQPFYGEIAVSLTTEGDVGADSALAVERFPVADETGTLSYERTFDLPEGVTAEDLMNGVIVQHGISALGGDPVQYDGDVVSPLDPNLPLEATIPTLCGALEVQAPGAGGASTTTTTAAGQQQATTTTAAGGTTTTTAAGQTTTTTAGGMTTTTAGNQVQQTPQGGVAAGAGGTAAEGGSMLPLTVAAIAGIGALGAGVLINRRRSTAQVD